MDSFWVGFEKQALLVPLVRGAGYASRQLRSGGSSLLESLKKVPGKVRAYPGKLHEAFLAGDVAAGNEIARKAGKLPKAGKPPPKAGKPPPKTLAPAQEAATTKAGPAPGTLRGRGKDVLTGGIIGGGGVYLANNVNSQPQYPTY